MIDTTVAHAPAFERTPSRLSRLVAASGDFLRLFAAAVRASRAVEAHRAPDRADLKTLGIRTKLPTPW